MLRAMPLSRQKPPQAGAEGQPLEGHSSQRQLSTKVGGPPLAAASTSGRRAESTASACEITHSKFKRAHLVGMQVHAADLQDRDGAAEVLGSIRYLFPWLRHVFADGADAGEKLQSALVGHGQWTLEIVKRSDQTTGFHVLPRRWVVERTFAWFGRNRRLAKDFERTIASSEAWL
jgi:Transposase DDE domain